MKVPSLNLRVQYEEIKDEIDRAIAEVLDSQAFILGPIVERFERQVADYCEVRYAVGVGSGTDALMLALETLGIGPGDRVITTPFTFFATVGAIYKVGAQPIFVDIEPDSFNLDPNRLADVLAALDARDRDRVKAIIPIHLYGQMADMDPIMEIAIDYGLHVIEDAAQTIGACYQGRRAGAIGIAGCFSFYPSKNLGGYGDGGMVVTDDESVFNRVRSLRVHGRDSDPEFYHHSRVGYNSRLDALQAAVLEVKLAHLDEWSAARYWIAQHYNAHLEAIDGIQVPSVKPDRNHIFHQYTIRVADGRRDRLQTFLKERGVESRVYYPTALHLQPCFANLGYRQGELPEAERAVTEVLSLPIYPELLETQRDYVVEMVWNGLKGG
ncbi:MAG: DegT/DnrJ/EryC1/StrS family aminotransferase [Candidatus Bipolaricaulia bacterium]